MSTWNAWKSLTIRCEKRRNGRINRWKNYSNINYCGKERVSKKYARSFWKLVNQIHSLSAHERLTLRPVSLIRCHSLSCSRCGVLSLVYGDEHMFIMCMIVHVAALNRKIALAQPLPLRKFLTIHSVKVYMCVCCVVIYSLFQACFPFSVSALPMYLAFNSMRLYATTFHLL